MSTEPRTLDLAPIQARCDAATPGPWEGGEDHHGQPTVYSGVDHWIAMLPHQCVEGIRQERERDAAFIAAARTDVPLLLAALRAERALVAAAMEQVDLAHAGNVETMNEANARVARLEAERDAARAGLARLTEASEHLCWLCTEHARLSEPEDLEAVAAVREAIAALEVARG